jgi:hypothetical protein
MGPITSPPSDFLISSARTPGTGVMNAVVVGNKITPGIATQSTQSLTTSTTTGSGTGATTTTSGLPVTTFKSVGNILIQTSGSLTTTGTPATVTGFTSYGTLNIKALDQVQLESMNGAAGVATVPLPVVISSGSGSNTIFLIPPPPNYDSSLNVPVPAP